MGQPVMGQLGKRGQPRKTGERGMGRRATGQSEMGYPVRVQPEMGQPVMGQRKCVS
jgi:hypothetical protein